jgi:gamma-glutamyl:cysteine ligase YbdK (ATP-grasp superfamily)
VERPAAPLLSGRCEVPRICDAQPIPREAQSRAALMHALGATVARALVRRAVAGTFRTVYSMRTSGGSIRYGLTGELIDFERGRSCLRGLGSRR